MQITDVIENKKSWIDTHSPYDRVTKLNLFQYVIDEGSGGALMTLSEAKKNIIDTNPPVIYLHDHAQSQYMSRLGYPMSLYNRLPSKLNVLNVNWLSQFGGYDRDVTMRMQDGNQARAVMSKLYQPFDTMELLQIAEPFLDGGVVRWHYDDEMTFHLSVSFPNYADEIRAGDIVERGFHLSNSEVGIRSVTIAGYTHRLICSNGAISRGEGDSFNFRHIGNPDKMRDMVRNAIETSRLQTERIIVQFQEALKTKIDEPGDFLEKICKENRLTTEQFRTSLGLLMGSPDKENLFGVSQSLSAAAHQFNGEQSYQMQRLSVDITK